MRWGRATSLLVALALGAACNPVNNMTEQPRYDPMEASPLFADGTSARPLPDGVVVYEPPAERGGSSADERPELTPDLLLRGQERFDVFCSPCHGRDGYGQGMVVRRGFPAPPSYDEPRLLAMSDARIVQVITNGLGKMPAYGPKIGAADRWAIVAYVRALQRSQTATLADVPPIERAALEEEGR